MLVQICRSGHSIPFSPQAAPGGEHGMSQLRAGAPQGALALRAPGHCVCVQPGGVHICAAFAPKPGNSLQPYTVPVLATQPQGMHICPMGKSLLANFRKTITFVWRVPRLEAAHTPTLEPGVTGPKFFKGFL